MDLLKTRVTEKLQTKYPNKTPAEIDEAVSRSEEYFRSTTRRLEVPEKAFWLWVDLSTAILTGTLTFSGNSGNQVVSSIKRGDTTVSYAESGSTASNLLEQVKTFRVVITR